MLLNYQQKQPTLDETGQNIEIIFIIHGLFGSLSNLAGVASALQQSHRIISIDLRNHGNSPHSPTMSYHEMANDVFELADNLNINSFSILGHSMGGKVAMACALQQPERIHKIAIADIAPVPYPDQHSDVFAGLQALAKLPITSRKSADLILAQYLHTLEVRQFLLKSLQKKGDTYQLQFNLPSLIANYESIRGWPTMPNTFNKETLFIKGNNSNYIIVDNQSAILHLFPKAKIKVIKNAGHWLHVEKAKIFNRLLSQFFS
ncbi:alpha/beta fold hydrolase [Psychromonas antarctica]|uniref:alpha/beta fold hydrolase n=1 Tax=Psychromonas antarctica TaxID=67573 RepID=UPI001EE92D21|nr:alpha/beta fold hydrolase [Psychromonas antarctica]MCG6201958.1 alpha/beta fold hydrolase [Psychromonas antarctica]